jgi:nitrogen fixation/metabolism regulation signal transduction histidine kinase
MIELIEVGIIVFDHKEHVILWNTAASNLTGIHNPQSWDQITRRNPEFAEKVSTICESCRVLYEALTPGSTNGRLIVQVLRTRMLDQDYSLMTIQDISSVVDQKETGAWIDLLRTLNHEIKNSITPISSLADTIMMILQGEQRRYKSLGDLNQDNLADIISAVETLQERSNSLYSFIDQYHKLTRLPLPDPVLFDINSLFREIHDIFRNVMENTGIHFILEEGQSGLEIRADRGLVIQVMINLIRNSLDAVQGKDKAEIIISGNALPDGVGIDVSDNGVGIDEDMLEDVFIPFFTTKTSGSGIGLSLVRQIMRLHGGYVRVYSQKNTGTSFCLVFPFNSDPKFGKR